MTPDPDITANAGCDPAPTAEAVAPRAQPPAKPRRNPGLFGSLRADIRAKSLWLYECTGFTATVKTFLTDGTWAMVYYRLMQWSRRWRLFPLEIFFNKINSIFCNCIIGRGAEFGPGFVLIHSTGVVINGTVRGGSNILIEHQVTIGADRRSSPEIGDDVFIGAGAKIVGAVKVGTGARVGANAVVVKDVPADATVVGIPARVVRQRGPSEAGAARVESDRPPAE